MEAMEAMEAMEVRCPQIWWRNRFPERSELMLPLWAVQPGVKCTTQIIQFSLAKSCHLNDLDTFVIICDHLRSLPFFGGSV